LVAACKTALAASFLLEPVGNRELEVEARLCAIRPALSEQVGAAEEGRRPQLSGAERARRNCAAHACFGVGAEFLNSSDSDIKRLQRGGRRARRRRSVEVAQGSLAVAIPDPGPRAGEQVGSLVKDGLSVGSTGDQPSEGGPGPLGVLALQHVTQAQVDLVCSGTADVPVGETSFVMQSTPDPRCTEGFPEKGYDHKLITVSQEAADPVLHTSASDEADRLTLEGLGIQVSGAVLTGNKSSLNNGSIHGDGTAKLGLHLPSAAESGEENFVEAERFDDDCGIPLIPADFESWTKARKLAWMEEVFCTSLCCVGFGLSGCHFVVTLLPGPSTSCWTQSVGVIKKVVSHILRFARFRMQYVNKHLFNLILSFKR
jgi:hypothetical protein